DNSLELDPADEDSAYFLKAVCSLQDHAHVILTGRYTIKGIPELKLTHCELHDAPYGDILHRMKRLKVPELLEEEKRWIYDTLGGNHRAIEWTASLLADKEVESDDLKEALQNIKIPPDTPEGAVKAVLAGMRENLLLSKLRQNLTTEQDRLLRAACLYRVPVNYDGLHLLDIDSTDHDTNRQRLIDYKLILTTYDTRFEMNRFFVPPIARELLKDHGFSPKEFKELNATAGKYHKYQGEHVSRIWSDDIEAIFHFRLAGDHITADELAKSVTYFQYSRSYFKMVNEMCVEIVNRKAPPPPWWALIRYGMCQLTLGNPKKALEAHENALPLSPTEKDRGTTLNNIAQIHKARGELDEATKYLEMSLKIKQEIRDKRGEGTIFNNIATIHYSRGEFDEALKYMELSIKIRQEIGDRTDEGTTLNNISQIHQERGENDEAMKYLKMSLYIYQEIGDRKGEGMTLNNISQIHSAHGEYDEAMKYLEMSLKIQQEIGNRAGEGATLSNIASNHYTRSKFDEALKYFKMSLKIQQEIGDRAGEGATLNNISQIYDARGEYDEAMKYLEMSLKIQEEIGDRAGEGRSLNNIGTINHARGKHKEAMNYLGMSLKIRQEIGDRKGEGMTLNNISQIHYARGELDEAMKYLAQSLKIQQEIGNRAGMIPTLNNMAHIAEQNKDPENAIKMWSEALNIALEIKNAEGIFHFAQALGLRAARDGAKDQAKQLLTMALNVGRQAGFPGTDEIEEDLRKLS
ncbi:MAG: tetratricopeptide repeat protein, partial [Candidatus Electryonea clarkiae]|nr:tetratricopeptide repeat protein [Candidatus Electryonea clarkiae]